MLRSNFGVTEQQKELARTRILERLVDQGPVSGDWPEIQAKLGLENMGSTLFKRSCWHLRAGDRDPDRIPRITVRREAPENRVDPYGPASFIIAVL